MKLQVQIGEKTLQVEIDRDGEAVFARIDGRSYKLEVSQPEPNLFLLKHEGKIREAFVSPNQHANEPYRVSVSGKDMEVRVIDPKRLRGTTKDNEHGDNQAEIKTAMPGKVVRIIAEKGTNVAKGEAVLVVEAMKMQNELRSPKDGIVAEIRAVEGATVAAGEILAVIE